MLITFSSIKVLLVFFVAGLALGPALALQRGSRSDDPAEQLVVLILDLPLFEQSVE